MGYRVFVRVFLERYNKGQRIWWRSVPLRACLYGHASTTISRGKLVSHMASFDTAIKT